MRILAVITKPEEVKRLLNDLEKIGRSPSGSIQLRQSITDRTSHNEVTALIVEP